MSFRFFGVSMMQRGFSSLHFFKPLAASLTLTTTVALHAFAAPGASTGPGSASSASTQGSSAAAPAPGVTLNPASAPASDSVQTLSVPAKSLLLQRLHSATLPGEAELRCSLLEDCFFGLTRGFSIGSDLFGTGVNTLLGQQVYSPGAWIFYDGKIGYQFLDGVGGKMFANGTVGYRGYSFRKEIGDDQNERKMQTRGFTFSVNFAQIISPQYSQGLSFHYFAGKTEVDEPRTLLPAATSGSYRKMLRDYYSFSQQTPQVRFGLPAEFELINWKASHIDLPNHLRGYLSAEPFYIQNEFTVSGEFESVEKNFGLRGMAMAAYESLQTKSGRMSFLLGVGFDLATNNRPEVKFTSDQAVAGNAASEDLPTRKVFSPLLNLEASYQF